MRMIKLILLLIVGIVIIANHSFSQGVSINFTGAVPNGSAVLDISSLDKGVLIPRMTNGQRQALKDPATGLIVYNTTSNQFNYYNGSGWNAVPNNNVSSSSGSGTSSGSNTAMNTSGDNADPSAILDVASVDKGLLIPRTTQGAVSATEGLIIYNTSTNKIDYYNGSSWNSLCNSFLDNTKGLGAVAHGIAINNSGSSPDPSAILDISSANKGILISRMTSAQRGTIKTPAQGLMIYNTTTDRIENWNGSAWYELQNNTDITSAPIGGTHVPSSSQIVWNWNTVTGATGYKYNTVNNYATATDNGTSTTRTQTGLTCSTVYTLYVWAYNDCGESTALTLNETTSACFTGCIPTGSTALVAVTNSSTGKTWMDRNLGAGQKATAYNDANAYGCLYQWGRAAEGHENRGSGTTTTLATTAVPNLGNSWDGLHINTNNALPNDWLSSQDNTLWQGVSGPNNPCPSGYRLPTEAELNAERLSWSTNNQSGAYGSPLRLPSGGYRTPVGQVLAPGAQGRYWTSTVGPRYLTFNSSNASMSINARAYGFSVRCIKN